MKLCPDCKIPVTFEPDFEMVIGGPDRSYYHCSNCNEKYDPSFPAFILKEKPAAQAPRVQCVGCGEILPTPTVAERFRTIDELSTDCVRCQGYGEEEPVSKWSGFAVDDMIAETY